MIKQNPNYIFYYAKSHIRLDLTEPVHA